MAPPPQITSWLRRTYPRPTVDPEWLEGCYSWIENELHLNPTTHTDEIIYNVNNQLLQSNLNDSMLAGTGLPQNINNTTEQTIRGPVLVEIISITEIGNSAFTLHNVRQTRLERADLAGLNGDDDGNNEDDEGPIPRYPRSMLSFQLSDGSVILRAVEYRRLPDPELGVTPLGYKMLLKDVDIRRGIAFLEPKNVILKGHRTEEREVNQDLDFLDSLRVRMGLPEVDPAALVAPPPPAAAAAPAANNVQANGLPQAQQRAPQHIPVPPPAPMQTSPGRAPRERLRSPLQDHPDPPEVPEPGPSRISHDDDAEQPRRRKLPNRPPSPDPPPPPRPLPTQKEQPTHSRFFSGLEAGSDKEKLKRGGGSQSGGGAGGSSIDLARELIFSPHRRPPIVIGSSSDDDEDFIQGSTFSHPRSSNNRKTPPVFKGAKGKDIDRVRVRCDSDVEFVDNGNGNGNDDPRNLIAEEQEQDGSSDYDFDFELGNEFLAEVDKMEMEAIAGEMGGRSYGSAGAPTPGQWREQQQRTRQGTATQSQRGGGSSALSGTTIAGTATTAQTQTATLKNPSTATSSSSGMSSMHTGSFSMGGTGRRPTASAPPVRIDEDVIDIDDDEEEDDKENIPVPTRHVRRRTQPQPVIDDEDVIIISD